jgi:2-amino-4-hydroxy-6-hydroxymethyldihydropteridine diphosphokinase
MAKVFLGIGSNIGNREKNIRSALDLLNKQGILVKKVSKIIRTKPIGGPSQGYFLNAAARIKTNFSPFILLKKLKNIEKVMGRTRGIRFGPRIIDLDILVYDNLKLKSKKLIIPHPRMWQREFVLKPLRSITTAREFNQLEKHFFKIINQYEDN